MYSQYRFLNNHLAFLIIIAPSVLYRCRIGLCHHPVQPSHHILGRGKNQRKTLFII